MLMKWEEFLVSSKERSRNWTERLGLEINTLFASVCMICSFCLRLGLISSESGEPD